MPFKVGGTIVFIAVGFFSFGAGTMAMQGAKAGARVISKKASEQLGKASFRKLEKDDL